MVAVLRVVAWEGPELWLQLEGRFKSIVYGSPPPPFSRRR